MMHTILQQKILLCLTFVLFVGNMFNNGGFLIWKKTHLSLFYVLDATKYV